MKVLYIINSLKKEVLKEIYIDYAVHKKKI